MNIWKNEPDQFVYYYLYNWTTGEPVTGEAANITLSLRKNIFGAGVSTEAVAGNPTEIDATLFSGYYEHAISQNDSNADQIKVLPKHANAQPPNGVFAFAPEPITIMSVNVDLINGSSIAAAGLKGGAQTEVRWEVVSFAPGTPTAAQDTINCTILEGHTRIAPSVNDFYNAGGVTRILGVSECPNHRADEGLMMAQTYVPGTVPGPSPLGSFVIPTLQNVTPAAITFEAGDRLVVI